MAIHHSSVYRLMRRNGYGASFALDAARADASGEYRAKMDYDPGHVVDPAGDDPQSMRFARIEQDRLDSGEWVARYVHVTRRCECCNAFSIDVECISGIVEGYADEYADALAYEIMGADWRSRKGGEHG